MEESPDLGPAPVAPRSESLRQLGRSGLHRSGRGLGLRDEVASRDPIHSGAVGVQGGGDVFAFSPVSAPLGSPGRMFSRRGCLYPGPGRSGQKHQLRREVSPSASPSLLPSFEALIVQYYNLKTSIIYFVLKRKCNFSFPLALLQSSSFFHGSLLQCLIGGGERR